jgi:hypothetical protein
MGSISGYRHPDRGNTRRGGRCWWAASAVLLVLAAGFLTAGFRGNYDALATASTGPATNSTPTQPVPARTSPGPTPTAADNPPLAPMPSPPVMLRIPTIDLAVSLSTLGLNPDQTVQVPTDFQQPGWFGLGPTPGQVGSAVILGHVDSYRGAAVFYRLRSLQAGDQVEVTLADGTITRFAVTTVASYPKEQFPAQQVYGSHGVRALQLVTCGGNFDTTARSYLSNIVAYTTLIDTTPPPTTPR